MNESYLATSADLALALSKHTIALLKSMFSMLLAQGALIEYLK